jgi:pimeloyl-ACP methyl ester carboxylesterase
MRNAGRRKFLILATGAAVSVAACAHTKTLTAPRVFRSDEARRRYLNLYAAVLQEWPIAYEQLYVPTRYGRTHIIASGDRENPPLILLHPFSASATVWRPNVLALSHHFRTYAVDVVGEPNKSESVRSIGDEREYAEWLLEVLDGLEIDRAHVVGNSLGGAIALNQAIRTPERIAKAALISPAVFPLSWRFYYYGGLGVGLGIDRIRVRLDEWMANGIAINAEDGRWAALMDYAASEGTRVNSIGIRVTKAQWSTITTPTLLLIGDKEVVYDREPAEVLAQARGLMASLKTDLVPNANHVAAMTNPRFVNERIIRFLREEPASLR